MSKLSIDLAQPFSSQWRPMSNEMFVKFETGNVAQFSVEIYAIYFYFNLTQRMRNERGKFMVYLPYGCFILEDFKWHFDKHSYLNVYCVKVGNMDFLDNFKNTDVIDLFLFFMNFEIQFFISGLVLFNKGLMLKRNWFLMI